MMLDWRTVVAGLLGGSVVGVTGVGGGTLMEPILVLLFGVAPRTAIGTALLFAATTKVCGTARIDPRRADRCAAVHGCRPG